MANLKFNRHQNKAEMLLYDAIGPEWMGYISAQSVAGWLNENKDVSEISIRINSPGGYVSEGFAIYNLLNSNPAKITVEIDGAALSVASVIAMVGDEIRMAKNASFMIHDPWGVVMGSAVDLRKEAEVLDKLKENIIGVYADRTGNDAKQISEWMTAETWFQSAEALANKFVDSVTENKTAPNLDPNQVNLSAFKNCPQWAKDSMTPEKVSPWKLNLAKRRLDILRSAG